jgi:hypothetical protein
MARTGAMIDKLHRATHRVPGVPAHRERSVGEGRVATSAHGQRLRTADHRSWNHQRREPRVLNSWQRRIGALFGQETP